MRRTALPRLAAVLCLCAIVSAWGRPSKEIERKERELAALKANLEEARNALQNEIAARWRAKQEQVGRRETDKEKLARLREAQERSYLDLSRVKEECFARERAIEDERKELSQSEEGWRFVQSSVGEMLRREADAVMEAFPLDREARREELEAIRRTYHANGSVSAAFADFVAYRLRHVRTGLEKGIDKQPLAVDDGEVRELTMARFGHVFGYGVGPDGGVYFIRQTGRLGPERYRIEKVDAEELGGRIAAAMPAWVEGDTVGGRVLTDVLQNDRSRALIAGEEVTTAARMTDFVKSGGWVMVPLLLMPVWALILVLVKLWDFAWRHRSNKRTVKRVFGALDRGDIAEAGEYARKGRGVVARVINVCLTHAEWGREEAEKGVREIVLAEAPRLNSHLNTLAVIAAVAPLLGLLGTVSGMIRLFTVITHYGTGDPRLMAGGISEALITTQTGLTIAIPILLVHNFLRNRRNKIRAEIERSAVVVLNRLWPTKMQGR